MICSVFDDFHSSPKFNLLFSTHKLTSPISLPLLAKNYSCQISQTPPSTNIALTPDSKAASLQRAAHDMAQMHEKCLALYTGWWSYEFCYGKQLRFQTLIIKPNRIIQLLDKSTSHQITKKSIYNPSLRNSVVSKRKNGNSPLEKPLLQPTLTWQSLKKMMMIKQSGIFNKYGQMVPNVIFYLIRKDLRKFSIIVSLV